MDLVRFVKHVATASNCNNNRIVIADKPKNTNNNMNGNTNGCNSHSNYE